MKAQVSLSDKGGMNKKTAQGEIELIDSLLAADQKNAAWHHLKQAVDRLKANLNAGDAEQKVYVSAVLKLSNLAFTLGKGLMDLAAYLHKAHEMTEMLGDRRSHALINMHLGRIYYFSDRRQDAMIALSTGLNEVEDLGDEDIMEQSAVFLGLFYFMQGLFKDARPHLDRAERLYRREGEGHLITPLTPVLLGYCLTYLGEFHRAIGSLDCHWRMAKDRGDRTLATTLRVILGTVLLLIKREHEADFHIGAAEKEALDTENVLAQYFAGGARALKSIRKGRMSNAYEIFVRSFEKGHASGFVRQFASPWIMEMIYEFERLGYKNIDELDFKAYQQRAVNENNVHLQGVALRLMSQKKAFNGESMESILADLDESRRLLEKSGDIVQIAKTVVEKARLELSRGNREEGRRLVKEAWPVLGGYAEEFFPDDLRYLLDSEHHGSSCRGTSPESFDRYIELTEAMFPKHEREDILARAVEATNRFFGAERGCLFWFPGGQMTRDPELRAACNVTQADVSSNDFKENKELILKAFRTGRPILNRAGRGNENLSNVSAKALLCLPVEIQGKIRAVLYHDNSYLEDCFDFLDADTLQKTVDHVSRQVARIWDYFQIREERNDLIMEKSIQEESSAEKVFLYESPKMAALIQDLDRVALSDSTILITGKTGVGKELVARRVHTKSRRHDKAFIIVDALTIPSTLIESELFGHEKGAFTGADRQKKGRLEMADKGTLFIDEIGELTPELQAKLLRAIQERIFIRLGGIRSIQSDFRLIAATNRDLQKAVQSGRFREDLYYRLNVVPFHIPPLRKRREDILPLANHFLNHFSRKYNRRGLHLDSKAEKQLEKYDWPGNVRELENIIERGVLMSSGTRLDIDFSGSTGKGFPDMLKDLPSLDELQKRYIEYVLEKSDGKLGGPGGASELLGLKRTTLYARMKKLGIR